MGANHFFRSTIFFSGSKQIRLVIVGQPNANLVKSTNKVRWLVKKLQNGAKLICEKPPSVFMKTEI